MNKKANQARVKFFCEDDDVDKINMQKKKQKFIDTTRQC